MIINQIGVCTFFLIKRGQILKRKVKLEEEKRQKRKEKNPIITTSQHIKPYLKLTI